MFAYIDSHIQMLMEEITSLIGIWAPLPFQMEIKNFSKRHFRVPSGEKGLTLDTIDVLCLVFPNESKIMSKGRKQLFADLIFPLAQLITDTMK